MARAKTEEVEDVVAAISEAMDSDVGADSEIATEDFLAAFGVDTDAKVSVHRHVEGQTRRPWLFTFSPVDTSYEEMMTVLRDDYGGGVFRIHVREAGRIVSNHAIQVEAPTPKRPDGGIPSTAAPETTPAAAAPAGDGLASIVSEMSRMLMDGLDRIAGQTSEQFKMLLEVMKATRSDAPPVDPLAMQTNILEGVARMREIAGANNDTESSIELFMRALELGRSLDSKGEASPNDVLLEGLKHFAPMIASASAGPAQPAAIPGGPERLPAPAAEEQSPVNAQAERLTQHARMLCQVASENRDPELYGEVTLDQLGPETAKALFVDPAGLDQLARLVPEVVNFRPWFVNMGGWITEILASLEADRRAAELAGAADPSLPDGHSRGAGGDPSDVEVDGDAGRAGEGAAPDSPEGPGADGAHSPEGVSG